MFKRILLAIQFLTKLPVIVPGKVDDEDMAGSLVYYPLVGLLIGGLAAGAYLLLRVTFPVLFSALLTLCFYVYLTGAFHLDGFVDTVDGFYGNRKKEDIFAIMKDSRIGAVGAVWLGLLLIIKAYLFISLAFELVPALILAAVLSRAGIVLLMRLTPAAKKTSLAAVLCEKNTLLQLSLALGFAFGVSIFFGIKGMLMFAVVLAVVLLLAKYFKNKIGGLTGDTIGFSVEFLEITVLILLNMKHF